MNFSAVILAGGKSSRMGRDKAFLEIDGQTLLARQIERVQSVGADEVFISGQAGVDYSAFGLRVLLDVFPNAGPIAGIHVALAAAHAPLLLVLAVDLVRMDAVFLREMAHTDVAFIPRIAGQIEPLAAVYPRAGIDIARRMLAENRFAVRDFATACVDAGLARFADYPPSAAGIFKNLNSPANLISA